MRHVKKAFAVFRSALSAAKLEGSASPSRLDQAIKGPRAFLETKHPFLDDYGFEQRSSNHGTVDIFVRFRPEDR